MEGSVSITTAQKSILLVDNDPNWRNLIGDLLVNEGYAVTTAESAPAATDALQSKRFNLVLINLHLKDESLKRYSTLDYQGVEVVDALPQYAPSTPCIVYSGHPGTRNLGSPTWCISLHKTQSPIDELVEIIGQVVAHSVLHFRLTRIRQELVQHLLPIDGVKELIAILDDMGSRDQSSALSVRLNLLQGCQQRLLNIGSLTPAEEVDRREAIQRATIICGELEEIDRTSRA